MVPGPATPVPGCAAGLLQGQAITGQSLHHPFIQLGAHERDVALAARQQMLCHAGSGRFL
jgi:hypothetical protein